MKVMVITPRARKIAHRIYVRTSEAMAFLFNMLF